MSLTQIHDFTGNAFRIFTLVITLFALFRFVRREQLAGDFWGTIMIGEGLAVIQAVLGIILVLSGRAPGRVIHFLYGALTVLLWPATFGYTRNQSGQRETLAWLLVSAFMFGLAIRAYMTGG